MKQSLKTKYKDIIIPKMISKFNYKNPMQVPKISHITINMGIGDAKDNPKKLESAVNEMTLISGQKPVTTRSKKIYQILKLEKDFLLDVRSRYAVIECMTFLKD